jgi:hypothetical protein
LVTKSPNFASELRINRKLRCKLTVALNADGALIQINSPTIFSIIKRVGYNPLRRGAVAACSAPLSSRIARVRVMKPNPLAPS